MYDEECGAAEGMRIHMETEVLRENLSKHCNSVHKSHMI
jgi:hypothetical protein